MFSKSRFALTFLTVLFPGIIMTMPLRAADAQRNAHYVSNRPPLTPSAFVKLPVGSIKAHGWLAEQLRLQIEGLTGHLDELFADVGPNSAWLGGDGEDWERGPYYIRGCTALAYATHDKKMLAKIKPWIEWSLNSQTSEGNFGPQTNLDWWPRMVMLQAIQIHYEATGDERVIPFMTKYFRYQLAKLPTQPLQSWAERRGGDNTESVLWLYNRTGDEFLLELAELLRKQTHDWAAQLNQDQPINAHVVNLSQGYKQPGIIWEFTHADRYRDGVFKGLEYVMKYHGRIDGMHAGDEGLAGKSGTRGTELCAVVEFMHSMESLIQIFGDCSLADRLEQVAYNAHPTMWMPDWHGHQYFCQPNQVQCAKGKRGFSTDHGDDLVFGVLSGYPCCATNGHMGWPMLNNHLWLATPDNGLAAVIYAPCEVTAKVADGTEVTIIEDTDYPFRDTINFTIKTPQPVAFPIQLRIPAWADKAELLVNGEPARTRPDNLEIKAGTFVHLTGHWKDGDKITLKLPMNIRITHWECSSIGIERGPLAYGIAPPEDWRKFPDWRRGDALDGWAAWEVHPDGRWEYAVELDTKSPQNSVEVIERDMHAQPWTYQNAPVALRMKARHVRGWGHDEYGNAAPPPISPVKTDTQLETIELRPYGCIRLRVAYIPVLADDQ